MTNTPDILLWVECLVDLTRGEAFDLRLDTMLRREVKHSPYPNQTKKRIIASPANSAAIEITTDPQE